MLSRVAAWVGGGLLGMVVALPFVAYIPWVQNKAADLAAEYASKKTGMDISVGDVNIKFPLDITATDVQVIDQNGDTLFKADEVKADVKPKPLIDKKVEVDKASLKGAKSQIKTEDGSMDLDVDLDEAFADGAAYDRMAQGAFQQFRNHRKNVNSHNRNNFYKNNENLVIFVGLEYY